MKIDEKALTAAIEHCDALERDDVRGAIEAYESAKQPASNEAVIAQLEAMKQEPHPDSTRHQIGKIYGWNEALERSIRILRNITQPVGETLSALDEVKEMLAEVSDRLKRIRSDTGIDELWQSVELIERVLSLLPGIDAMPKGE